MKKIYILLSLLFLFIVCSCQAKVYNITLNVDEFLNEYYSYETQYEIEKNQELYFPDLEPVTYINEELEKLNDKIVYTRIENTISIIGWEDESGVVIQDASTKISQNQTYTPVYIIDQSSKTINLITNGVEVELNSNQNIYICTLPTINNENYSFDGWYYNEMYKGEKVETLSPQQIYDGVTLYAKLTPKTEYVEKLINDIPDKLTIYNIDDINNAYNTYQLLSYQDKQAISNYDKLKDAYSQIENLNKAADVYNSIIEIYGKEVTADLKAELDIAVESLEALEPTLKEYWPEFNIDELYDLVEKVNNLYELYIEDAKAFDKRIAQVPLFVEQYYIDEIKQLKQEYEELNPNIQMLLKTTSKLETLYQNVLNIETQQVTYYYNTSKTNNVYESKQQLFTAFFSDFYYYIAAYHGLDHLKKNKLNNVDEFVSLACNFNGAGVSNLYGIGNIAGRYMLEKDINGILANQTENGYFGFCYLNNLYQDVLPFFINFFAFWRIDERYANTSNYGADIFAESWAPTVDIAKFFYYDENTSYVKTERMIDCLTNTASVAYGMGATDLPTLKLRGYKFEGWYDNPEYKGSPITSINKNETVNLYAKWTIDHDQIDKDEATLVDVYIYNLTTKPAVVNKTTVGYVEQMYNNLSQKGKELVENYSTLKKLIQQYR